MKEGAGLKIHLQRKVSRRGDYIVIETTAGGRRLAGGVQGKARKEAGSPGSETGKAGK